MKRFVFSIDIEDWFQVENFKEKILYEEWNKKEIRVVTSTKLVLDILRKNGIKATFFVLAWIAEKRPELVKMIVENGHEIASHGYGHELLHKMSTKEIREDFKKSVDILAPLSKNKIVGYRAPSFSIMDSASDILKEMGFIYDASFNRFQFNKRYGEISIREEIDKPTCYASNLTFLKNGLIEFPVSISNLFFMNWPLGGGYFRLSPTWFLKKQLSDIFENSDIANIYLHPWEFDSGQPRIKSLRKGFYYRHYYGLNNTAEKLQKFIELVRKNQHIEIKTFGEVIADYYSESMES